MASREAWCAEKVSKLLNEDERIHTLNEIKEYLTSLTHEEAITTINSLQLPLVFDCLNDSNPEQVNLACEVLSLCMNNLSLGESTSRYGVSLERALIHPNSSVKLMALTEIERNIHEGEVMLKICKRTSLFNNIIRCIADNDLSVAKKASNIVKLIGLSETGIKFLIAPEIRTVGLKEVLSFSETIQLRVFEVFIDISKQSESSFNQLLQCQLLSPMLAELGNNDVLLTMSILELLTQLGLSRHGYNYLESNGILNKMLLLFDENEDPISLQLCEPGILKFFGHMANVRPLEALSKYPKLFDRLFSNLESSDLTIVAVSLETLGHIGHPNEGKLALNSTGNKMRYAVKVLVKLLPSLPTDIRVKALNCLENLIQIEDHRNEISSISRIWYNLLGDQPMDLILKYAKNPFPEIRLAGLGILNAVAGHYWGQEEIKQTPGLVEFLLDRTAENTKESKLIKYDIIKQLSTSDVFDQPTKNKLTTYVKEGPFFVQAITEVAIEGND